MKIETKRLVLRELTREDKFELKNLLNNINITKWLLNYRFPFTIKDAEELIKKSYLSRKERPRKSYSFIIQFKEKKSL
ncbi:MAG: hypothetical protein QW103_00260 [Candidatus Pacearchaeota archaeon]